MKRKKPTFQYIYSSASSTARGIVRGEIYLFPDSLKSGFRKNLHFRLIKFVIYDFQKVDPVFFSETAHTAPA